MRVLVTGANGFIGQALVRELLRQGVLADGRQNNAPISQIVLADREFPVQDRADGLAASIPLEYMTGDLADPAFIATLASLRPQAVFHLAASLTLQAEDDHDTAYRVNVDSVRQLIAGLGADSRLVFSSSIAVFGGTLPDVVSDEQHPAPATTYGTHKAIVELLMADAARKGVVDARCLRLPIVLVRSGSGSGSVSDQVAAIVREPLAGRDVHSGLSPDKRMPVASATAAAKALIQLHNLSPAVLPAGRVMNLPSLTVTPQQMVQAVARVAGPSEKGHVHFVPDARLQRIVQGWPREFVSEAATRLGIRADASFDAIIQDYLGRQHTLAAQ